MAGTVAKVDIYDEMGIGQAFEKAPGPGIKTEGAVMTDGVEGDSC